MTSVTFAFWRVQQSPSPPFFDRWYVKVLMKIKVVFLILKISENCHSGGCIFNNFSISFSPVLWLLNIYIFFFFLAYNNRQSLVSSLISIWFISYLQNPFVPQKTLSLKKALETQLRQDVLKHNSNILNTVVIEWKLMIQPTFKEGSKSEQY